MTEPTDALVTVELELYASDVRRLEYLARDAGLNIAEVVRSLIEIEERENEITRATIKYTDELGIATSDLKNLIKFLHPHI
ncbi:MAG: hypothetical protein SCH70_07130 [Candidatus Methanoperedens sp.]|nr:hypothetical protein [Candidatus Methanoperedens sp.]